MYQPSGIPLVHLGMAVRPVPTIYRRIVSAPRFTTLTFLRNSGPSQLVRLILLAVTTGNEGVRQLCFVGWDLLSIEGERLVLRVHKDDIMDPRPPPFCAS